MEHPPTIAPHHSGKFYLPGYEKISELLVGTAIGRPAGMKKFS